jgi:cystathionine beta-lyase/cystathionine gamma-synthase
LSEQEAATLGITAGTIRLSVGIESIEFITGALEQGLAGAAS